MTHKRTFAYNKLLRDKIIDSMRDNGDEFEHTILDDGAFLRALVTKLAEESHELKFANEDDILSELADLEEIITTIIKLKGFNRTKLTDEMAKKRAKRGGFSGRNYVGSVTLDEDNPWVRYLESNPEQYPEIKPNSKLHSS